MTFIADMTHYVELLVPGAQIPPAARRLGSYLGSIVSAASVARPNAVITTDLRCRRRPGRKACSGHIRFRVIAETGEILWECTTCADNGVIHNWQGTLWDFSRDAIVVH